MNTITKTLLCSLALASNIVWADTYEATIKHHTDYAKVTEVTPIYETVAHRTPHKTCWEEEVRAPRRSNRYSSGTPIILGTIIGGALGNELGHKKRNKQVGAVLGGVLGGSIGRDIGNRRQQRNHYDTVMETRCRVEYETKEEDVLSGYWVSYRYAGEIYRARMDKEPGDKIKVRVKVQPV